MTREEVQAAVDEAFGQHCVEADPDGSFTAELGSFQLTFAARDVEADLAEESAWVDEGIDRGWM